jgi:Holliday junction resolvase-like predicted endonuclease
MSGASSRRKGNAAEVEVVRALERAGYRALTSRAARGGYQSGEDIVTNFPLAIEVKNQARLDLAGWWAQATAQAVDKPAVIVHKRVGKTMAEDWWVTMDLATLIRLVGELREH